MAGGGAADAPGSELAQKGLDDTPEPIPNPAFEVYFHGVTRGAQLGGLVAALGAIPYHIWRPTTGSGNSGGGLLLRRMAAASILGCVGGGLFLAMGVYQKLAASDAWGVYDRAYRLRFNKGQRLWDRLAYTSASMGLFLGSVVLNGGLFGAAAGFSSGLSLGLFEFAAVKKLNLLHHLPALLRDGAEEDDDEGVSGAAASGAAAAAAAAAKKAD